MKIALKPQKKVIKITSLVNYSDKNTILVGNTYLADFALHLDNGVYAVQVWHEGKCHICTSCRLRFKNEQDHLDLFI